MTILSKKPKVTIETHGCKLNQSDSLNLSLELSQNGYLISESKDDCDIYILNTCTVTHVADRKGRQSARSFKNQNPNSIVVVTGCYAQRAKEELESLPEVDLVFGNESKSEIVNSINSLLSISPDESLLEIDQLMPSKNRAMIKIQEGCNQICSYCIVPRVRGREKSVEVKTLINQIKKFEELGFQEIVMTGTQLGSYGFDLQDMNLTKMLKEVLKNTTIPRIRVSSLQPQEISNELLEVWDNKRLCNHFHIPMQSGSNQVLKQMRRRYTSEQFTSAVDLINNNFRNASITTDVIVGFPNETESDFQLSKSLSKYSQFSDMHIFKFSKRPKTSAFFLKDNVDSMIKNSRSSELTEIRLEMFKEFRHKQDLLKEEILWENYNHSTNSTYGLTKNYIRVENKTTRPKANTIQKVKLSFNPSNPPNFISATEINS
tara:strand:- start:327 stop:1622 length:1296 start_codon:yes stop_codon:yes gene_type:complete